MVNIQNFKTPKMHVTTTPNAKRFMMMNVIIKITTYVGNLQEKNMNRGAVLVFT